VRRKKGRGGRLSLADRGAAQAVGRGLSIQKGKKRHRNQDGEEGKKKTHDTFSQAVFLQKKRFPMREPTWRCAPQRGSLRTSKKEKRKKVELGSFPQ